MTERTPDVPAEVRRLADQRERARADRRFGEADALRERIRAAGFMVTDTPEGPQIAPAPVDTAERSVDDHGSPLERPPTVAASLQWIAERWPEDVRRGVASFDRHHAGRMQHVVVEGAGATMGDWPAGVEVVHVPPGTGWAEARNAGLERASGSIVLVVDGSVEALGDVLGPIEAALEDPTVGMTGPFGIVSDDLREFRDAPGTECDAVEAYLMAFRRDVLLRGVRFDPKFRFYRSADIEFSFQVKALGLRATVTPVPVRRHEHRTWEHTPQDERQRLSKRNFYRFLDRWRGRSDLLVSRVGREAPAGGAPGSAPRGPG